MGVKIFIGTTAKINGIEVIVKDFEIRENGLMYAKVQNRVINYDNWVLAGLIDVEGVWA